MSALQPSKGERKPLYHDNPQYRVIAVPSRYGATCWQAQKRTAEKGVNRMGKERPHNDGWEALCTAPCTQSDAIAVMTMHAERREF